MNHRTSWPARRLLGREEKEAVDRLFEEAMDSGEAFGYDGPQEEAYCREFAACLGGGFADAVNSGTSAVYAALLALDLEPFGEVIVSPITDPGGMMPVALLNQVPVIADSVPGSYNTGPQQLESLINEHTRAILVAHIGGEPLDMEGIMELAGHHHLPVIEDCAQAHGASLKGKPLGTFADLAVFSTMSGKHFCTGGQGGIVFCQKEDLYWRVRRSSDRGKPFGLPAGSSNRSAALNLNLGDLAAAIGRVQLRKLPGIVRRRRDVAAAIAAAIAPLAPVSMPEIIPGGSASYWFLRLRFHPEALKCDKEAFCRALMAEGLPVNPAYRALPHLAEWFTERKVFGNSGYPWHSPLYHGDRDRIFPCPKALEAVETHFNLAINENWTAREVDDAAAILKKVGRASSGKGGWS